MLIGWQSKMPTVTQQWTVSHLDELYTYNCTVSPFVHTLTSETGVLLVC